MTFGKLGSSRFGGLGAVGSGVGLPAPPAGYAYVVDSLGNFVVDANGAYVIAPV